MKSTLIFQVLFFIFCTVSQAQVKKSPDYETAKIEAQNENKDILIVLTGSEWCKPCMKMKKNVFENPEFIEYATQNFVIFEVNMERHFDMDSKLYKQYAFFKQKYQTNALPSLILLDSNENLKGVLTEKLTSLDKTIEKLKALN